MAFSATSSTKSIIQEKGCKILFIICYQLLNRNVKILKTVKGTIFLYYNIH